MSASMCKNYLAGVCVVAALYCPPPARAIDLNLLMQAIIERDKSLVFQLLRQFSVEAGGYHRSDRITSLRLGVFDHVVGAPRSTLSYSCERMGNYLTPLQLAAGYSTPEIVEMLVNYGANVEYADVYSAGITPLQYACRYGKTENARVLLANGADPNRRPFRGWGGDYPIHEAVKSGNTAIVSLLLDTSNETVNALNRFMFTPLYFARNSEIFDLLVQHGADVNAVNQDGRTVLHEAVTAGDTMISAKIMENGNFHWDNIYCRIKRHTFIWKHSIQLHATHAMSVQASKEGDTLLHAIARSRVEQLETAIIMLAHGLDPRLTNSENETAIDIARAVGSTGLGELLDAATIARSCPVTPPHRLPVAAEPLSLQLWSAHAIRRDATLWDSAVSYLPQHMVAFVLGTNWQYFQKINKVMMTGL